MAGNFFAGTCIFGYAKLCLFPAKRTETDTKDVCRFLKRSGLVQSPLYISSLKLAKSIL